MTTLHISDLDFTLLRSDATLAHERSMWSTGSSLGAAIWDRIADSLLETRAGRRPSLTASARLLARTNIAMADAVISIWDSKNFYDRWRPITAIHAADTDSNPATVADPTWSPLLVTPPFQEYPAAHPGISQAAASVLAAQFGDNTARTSPAWCYTPSCSGGRASVVAGDSRSIRAGHRAVRRPNLAAVLRATRR